MTPTHSAIIGAMSYEEFHRHVRKAGLTIKAFAELMRMNRISLSNLSKKGDVPPHWAVIAALLGEMKDKGIDYRDVLSRIEITPRKPRGAGRTGKFGGDKQMGLDLGQGESQP
jgi:hypothetical protein